MTEAIYNAELRAGMRLDVNGTILVSISGGSDSDIVIDLVERFKGNARVIYIFFDTGLEYEATKRHLDYLEERYGVEIVRMPAVVPIPTSCKTYGVPFFSKQVSEYIERLQRHNFQWEDAPFEELYLKYPKCKGALRWWCNEFGENSRMNIKKISWLKEFIIANHPPCRFSNKCCEGAKKKPLKKVVKETQAVLSVNGMRRSEGGVRAVSVNSCFSEANDKHGCEYRPVFFFSDDDKFIYEVNHKIVHSMCYTVYGLKRTGCFGCPFGSGFEEELKAIEEYEPELFRAANAIFGKSYDYTRRYRIFKEQKKAEEREDRKRLSKQKKIDAAAEKERLAKAPIDGQIEMELVS